jgi:ABC-type multidrug transport system fused ATPase/permease subunit
MESISLAVPSIQTVAKLTYSLKALFSLSISTLDTLPSGQASNTLTNTANVLQIGISEKLGTFLQFTSLMITAIIIAFTYSWSLALVTCSILLFIGFVYGITIPIVVRWTKEVEHADEKASTIAGEVLGSIRMIVACGAEGRIARKYSGWVKESRRRGLKLSPLIGLQFAPCKLASY